MDNAKQREKEDCLRPSIGTNFFFNLLKKAKKAKKTSATSGGKRNPSKKDRERAISAQHDELVITEILRSPLTLAPAHPQFGGKEPKQHKPPKCISMVCKEEKESLQKKLEDVTETLQNTKRELLRFQEQLSKCELVMPYCYNSLVS